MRKTVTLTIDVEHDCPPFLKTYRGIETGLPAICSLLERYNVEATFFATGDVASKYPQQIKKIAEKHEIGCHGYSHKRFDKMSCGEAEDEIEKSTDVLRRLAGRVRSFRAPNLKFPQMFTGLLKDNGYLIDSSIARYKLEGILGKNKPDNGLMRVPVSITSSALRLPLGIEIIRRLPQPIVLFFHPWEFVDMRNEPVRWDCRINTGAGALANLESLIEIFKNNNYYFSTMSGFLEKR